MKYEYLGLAGLLPFLTSAALLYFDIYAAAASASLIFYSVAILSFLGGVQWGVALCKKPETPARFLFSVFPSIAAWAAFAIPNQIAMLFLAACFTAFFVVERAVFPISERYQRLRASLSVTVIFCLLISSVRAV